MKNGIKCVTELVLAAVLQKTHGDFLYSLLVTIKASILSSCTPYIPVLKNLNIDYQNVNQKNNFKKYKFSGQFEKHWPGIARKFMSAGGKNGAENNRL